jgi:hypothetical protein
LQHLFGIFPSQTDERVVSGDGFMLNFLSVLQQLSIKIKLDKVDATYPNHPKSRVGLSPDDTRLKCTTQELQDWLNDPGIMIPILLFLGYHFFFFITFQHVTRSGRSQNFRLSAIS